MNKSKQVWMVIVGLIITYALISWGIDVSQSSSKSVNCKSVTVVKQIKLKDSSGKIMDTREETETGLDCGDGFLYPSWEER